MSWTTYAKEKKTATLIIYSHDSMYTVYIHYLCRGFIFCLFFYALNFVTECVTHSEACWFKRQLADELSWLVLWYSENGCYNLWPYIFLDSAHIHISPAQTSTRRMFIFLEHTFVLSTQFLNYMFKLGINWLHTVILSTTFTQMQGKIFSLKSGI
jgi:hypothetical protein